MDRAKTAWEVAAQGKLQPSAVWFYNDQQPDKIFYQGLALRKLGRVLEANEKFDMLLEYGKKHIRDEVKIDYFAVSMPDLLIWEEDIQLRNEIHCRYLMALGLWGKGIEKEACLEFKKVLDAQCHHAGAKFHLRLMQGKHKPWSIN